MVLKMKHSMKSVAMTLSILAPTEAALAQTPYAGMQNRAIKALSDKEVADLKAGRGMGLALPAELNGYPGPSHVLEHADALELTVEQRKQTNAFFEAMKAEAVSVGARLLEQETQLDRLFAARQITSASLAAATAEIGATQAQLRETHLKYHLSMMTVLTAEQLEKYQTLRGYASGAPVQHQHRHN
jgi:Spy/CpxP family protein refolding chaperone